MMMTMAFMTFGSPGVGRLVGVFMGSKFWHTFSNSKRFRRTWDNFKSTNKRKKKQRERVPDSRQLGICIIVNYVTINIAFHLTLREEAVQLAFATGSSSCWSASTWIARVSEFYSQLERWESWSEEQKHDISSPADLSGKFSYQIANQPARNRNTTANGFWASQVDVREPSSEIVKLGWEACYFLELMTKVDGT